MACHHEVTEQHPGRRGKVTWRKTFQQWAWPSGGSWLEEESLVSEMFLIIRHELNKTVNRG